MKKFQGEKVRELRKLRGLTVRELAKIVKVSPTYISKIENNKVNPSVPVLETIALALNSEPGYFFEPENNKTNSLTDFLKHFETKNPDTLTVEEALDIVLRSDHVMFNGKPVGKLDEDVLLDIRDTVVAVLKTLVSKKAAVGVRGVLGSCLVAGMGTG